MSSNTKTIKDVSHAEFPVSTQYSMRLYKNVINIIENLSRKGVDIKIIENVIDTWDKGLLELRTGTKESDFNVLKDKNFQKIVMQVHLEARSTQSNPDKSKAEFVYYYDILLFLGLFIRKHDIPKELMSKVAEECGIKEEDINKYYIQQINSYNKN
jgi:hypothetical protein